MRRLLATHRTGGSCPRLWRQPPIQTCSHHLSVLHASLACSVDAFPRHHAMARTSSMLRQGKYRTCHRKP
eukprot:1158746-Pelagomonas_calceolata.AAC.11